ncbi:hypothetical protein [Pontiella sp.]|uniref:hypothetical protein n=1 Tax=Pontiella sp. TaxID=2837462 RepID=UPI0035699157
MYDHEYRPGGDFLTGFLAALVVAILAVILMFAAESPNPLFIGAVALAVGGIVALVKRRPFIGVGIFTLLVAAPLLLIGSCFALFALG